LLYSVIYAIFDNTILIMLATPFICTLDSCDVIKLVRSEPPTRAFDSKKGSRLPGGHGPQGGRQPPRRGLRNTATRGFINGDEDKSEFRYSSRGKAERRKVQSAATTRRVRRAARQKVLVQVSGGGPVRHQKTVQSHDRQNVRRKNDKFPR